MAHKVGLRMRRGLHAEEVTMGDAKGFAKGGRVWSVSRTSGIIVEVMPSRAGAIVRRHNLLAPDKCSFYLQVCVCV